MEHLTPTQAYESLQSSPDSLLIDCRTETEFFYVGHPVNAVNIAWNSSPDRDPNPRFCDDVLHMAGRKDRPIVLICRSGRRSLDAANALERAGFSQVSNVLEGFEGDLDANRQRSRINGWRHRGLPWRQR